MDAYAGARTLSAFRLEFLSSTFFLHEARVEFATIRMIVGNP